MKCFLTSATAVLLMLLTTPAAFAEGAGVEWDILNQEVLELLRTGKYDRGVVVAKKALEVAETNVGPNHPDVGTSLNNLALLYKTQGHYAQAEPLYKRSLAIHEKALGPDHPSVATSLNNLATYSRGSRPRRPQCSELYCSETKRSARSRSNCPRTPILHGSLR